MTEPPNGALALDELREFIRRYVSIGPEPLTAVTLWVVHTHLIDAADATPYLFIHSPERRSGKTRLLEILELVVARPWLTSRVSVSAITRKLDQQPPATLLLDEADAALQSRGEYAEALRGVLDAGHRRGGVVSLSVGGKGNYEPKDLKVFGPKAIAGIGWLPETIVDRSIPILMRRRTGDEQVNRLRHRVAVKEAAELMNRRFLTWVSLIRKLVRDAEPGMPLGLNDRAEDGWEPLLAIADAAGGTWPDRARHSAIALANQDQAEVDSLGVRLLKDIRGIFGEADRIFSEDLICRLLEDEEAPWGDLRGKPLDKRALATRLRRYGIRPMQLRSGGENKKGYLKADFDEAWARYC